MSFIPFVKFDYESIIEYKFMTIYKCTDGVIVVICPCMLLANPVMLPYWIIVYVYVLCVYYMYMQILAHC